MQSEIALKWLAHMEKKLSGLTLRHYNTSDGELVSLRKSFIIPAYFQCVTVNGKRYYADLYIEEENRIIEFLGDYVSLLLQRVLIDSISSGTELNMFPIKFS